MLVNPNELVQKCRDARAGGWERLGLSDQLLTALVLNRADWLGRLGYTIPMALRHLGSERVEFIPDVERVLAGSDGPVVKMRLEEQSA